MWQDPMDDTQQTETRRRIRNILRALISELKSRGLDVVREDENTLIVNGMKFTATDQLSDTYNDVCYLLTDYNQMIEATLSRISECADTIEELLEVQMEKMRFTDMVSKQRQKNGIGKYFPNVDKSQFQVGIWYYADVVNTEDQYEYGFAYDVNVKIIDRQGDYITCESEYGNTYRKKVKQTVINGESVEYFTIKELDKARFYSSFLSDI